MSADIYPAILVDKGEHKHWQNVVPLEGHDERLCEAARKDPMFEGEAFEPNPDYIPFSHLNMANGNWYAIRSLLGLMDDQDGCGSLPIETVFKNAHEYLCHPSGRVRDMEHYVFERALALREMARLGKSRGATHIVWS
jgi:hypothetical protein